MVSFSTSKVLASIYPMNSHNHSHLNLDLLENRHYHPDGKITAGCPACQASGLDRRGKNHLVVFPNGAYSCIVHNKCDEAARKQHLREIRALIGRGTPQAMSPEHLKNYRASRIKDQIKQMESRLKVGNALAAFRNLLDHYSWSPTEMLTDSPVPWTSILESDPRVFLGAMFAPESVVWAGELHHSGYPNNAKNWRPVSEWIESDPIVIGPFTTPAIWMPGTFSRKAEFILEAPYTVLDFDELFGRKPTTPEEISELFHASLAVTRWLRERFGWQLRAIIQTGGKSLHVWFETPSLDALESLRDLTPTFGIDHRLIGCPGQACRLPGHPHQKTKNMSRLLWLKKSHA
jgi:hypothetical protein